MGPFMRHFYPMVSSIAGKKRFAILHDIKNIPFLPEEEIHRLTMHRMASLVSHAAAHVPYYGELFRSQGIDPHNMTDPARFAGIPLLTRSIINRRLEDLVATSVPKAHLIQSSTGGSTGVPVRFIQDRDYKERGAAVGLRSFSWAGWSPGDRMAWIWGGPMETKPLGSFIGKMKWRLKNSILLDAFRASPGDMLSWADAMLSFCPRFVNGYASALSHCASFFNKRGIVIPGIKGVFSTAERLDPAQRHVIEDAFQCKVYDQYGSREVLNIAAECSRGNMHVLSDSVYAEFVDIPGSEIKKIVVTPLHNTGMPMLRYEIGDCGIPKAGRCGCGIRFPMMEMKIGRISDNFVAPGGRVIHGEYFTHLLYGTRGIEKFQFHQTDVSTIRLSVVKNGEFDRATQDRLTKTIETIHTEISPRISVIVSVVEDIPPTPAGKHRFTISDIRPVP